jgi:hypothetical protein
MAQVAPGREHYPLDLVLVEPLNPPTARPYHRCSMLFALGGHFLYREISRGNWIVVAALVGVVILLRFWPQIVAWVEQRWRAR